MAAWLDEYHTRPNGNQPAKRWLEGQEGKQRAVIHSKMQSLREEGLTLLSTKILKPIKGKDRHLYELVSGQCRVCTYFDEKRRTFVYLCGWLKKKRVQRDDVDGCRKLLHEYQSQQEGSKR